MMTSSASKSIRLPHSRCIKWVILFNMFLLPVLLLLISPSYVYAQINQLQVGDRVRVTAPIVEQYRIKGTVTEIDKSVLVLSVRDSSFYISEFLIHRIETSVGKKRVIGRGVVIGAVTGTMMFGMVSAFANNACGLREDCIFANRDGTAFLKGAATGLATGALIGAVTGFFTKIDQWERVPFRVVAGTDSLPINFDQKAVSPTLTFQFPISK